MTVDLKAEWLKMRADPVYFAEKLLPLKPHPGQVKWLENATQPINVLVPGNRFGKSTVIAMRHIWHCMFKIGATPTRGQNWRTMQYETISVAHSADQAEIVYRMAERLISHPAIAPFIARTYTTPFPRIVFRNGAVMHCRSAHDDGKYIDGHAYRFLSIDEAGWIKNLKQLMNGVILLRLAGGGMVDLIGTPKGRGDLFWYANRGLRGVEGYYTQRGSIYDNPYLSAEDIKMRDALLASSNPKLREQAIHGAFVMVDGMAFGEDQLDQAFSGDLPAHVEPIEGHRYVQGWDLGRRTDWTVGVTLDVTERPWHVVDYQRLNRVPWESLYTLIKETAAKYGVTHPRIDATGPMGDVVEEELTKRGVFVDPFKTSTAIQKTNLINTLQSAFDYNRQIIGYEKAFDEAGNEEQVPIYEAPGEGDWGLVRIPSYPQMLDELGTYELNDKDLVQDSVMALALAVSVIYDGTLLYQPVMGGLYDLVDEGLGPVRTVPSDMKVPMVEGKMR